MTSSMHPSILGVCGRVSSYVIRCLMDNIETGLEVENLVDGDYMVTDERVTSLYVMQLRSVHVNPYSMQTRPGSNTKQRYKASAY